MPSLLVVLMLRRLLAIVSVLLAVDAARTAGHVSPASTQPARSLGHDQGDDHLLEPSRDAGRDPRGRSGCGNLYRTRASARGRWQSLQRAGFESPARHAVGVR